MAKGSKKSAGGAKKGGKKGGSKRKGKKTWSVYVHRALKQVNKELTISKKAIGIVNSFVTDMFDRIATEAASLSRVNKKKTLGSRELKEERVGSCAAFAPAGWPGAMCSRVREEGPSSPPFLWVHTANYAPIALHC